MSYRQEEKKSTMNPPTLLSSRAITSNIFKIDKKTFEKQEIFNSSVTSEDRHNKNNTEIKDKEQKSQVTISYLTHLNFNDQLFGNKTTTNIQTTSPIEKTLERPSTTQCYQRISNIIYSKRMMWFYYINIIVSIGLICAEIVSFFIQDIKYAIICLCFVVFIGNLIEAIAKIYVLGIWTYLRKFMFIFDALIVFPTIIGLVFLFFCSSQFQNATRSIFIITGTIAIIKSGFGIFHQFNLIKKESAVRKNVEEIIQFESEIGDKSFRKTNKKGVTYLQQVNDIN